MTIITEERYLSLLRKYTEQYEVFKLEDKEDKRWLKVGRVLELMKKLYAKDKIYAIKQMNYLETYQVFYDTGRGALIVNITELLKKLILQKKLEGVETEEEKEGTMEDLINMGLID